MGKRTLAVVNVQLNTITTLIDLSDATSYGAAGMLAVYFSPDTGTIYVDTSTDADVSSVFSFDSLTGTYKDEFPAGNYAQGQEIGTSIYLGNETFIACESTSSPVSRVWKVAFANPITLDPEKVLLKDIVADISNRCNLPSSKYNVRALTQPVDGYCVTSVMPGRAAIEPLAQAFAFDSVESDGVIKFVRRGGTSVTTVPMKNILSEGN